MAAGRAGTVTRNDRCRATMTPHWADSRVEVYRYVVGPMDNNVFVIRCHETGDAVLLEAVRQRKEGRRAVDYDLEDGPRIKLAGRTLVRVHPHRRRRKHALRARRVHSLPPRMSCASGALTRRPRTCSSHMTHLRAASLDGAGDMCVVWRPPKDAELGRALTGRNEHKQQANNMSSPRYGL